jgi:hypothetical protein
MLFEHQNTDTVCNTVYFYLTLTFYLLQLACISKIHKNEDTVFDIKILMSNYHFSKTNRMFSIQKETSM